MRFIAVVALLCFASATFAAPATRPTALDRIRVSDDKTHFVLAGSKARVVMWGFNYDRDDAGRLIEDYWADEWATVEQDFREMRDLGGNVVRVHLQFGRFMRSPDEPDAENLKRLARLVKLAGDVGLYLDVTGLGCYHKKDVPAWYAALGEADRWSAQANFWKAVAGVCKGSPAVFCYDLMNEPIVGGPDPKDDWLPGEPLGGKHFVQRITLDAKGRTSEQVAKAWIATLTAAVRSVDDTTLVTVGVIPWAQVFKGAKPVFYSPEACGPLDFVAVHFYPNAAPLEETLAALKVYDVGKPMVIEEIFPLGAGVEKTAEFIKRSGTLVDGYVSFYWGKTIDENRKKGDVNGALVAAWLEKFRSMSPHAAGAGAGAEK
ncbi:MAG TPA: cellulase family glycosylhydrolase [Humisphaera sp.]